MLTKFFVTKPVKYQEKDSPVVSWPLVLFVSVQLLVLITSPFLSAMTIKVIYSLNLLVGLGSLGIRADSQRDQYLIWAFVLAWVSLLFQVIE